MIIGISYRGVVSLQQLENKNALPVNPGRRLNAESFVSIQTASGSNSEDAALITFTFITGVKECFIFYFMVGSIARCITAAVPVFFA